MRAPRARWILILAVAVVAASACSSKAKDDPGNAVGGLKTGPGVSADVITLGVLSDLTGPFAASSEQQLAGANLYWDEKNAQGGVCGHKVELLVRDHHYDPQAALSLYTEIEPETLALQMSVGAPTTAAIIPQLQQDGVPTVPMSFSSTLLQEPLIVPGTTYDLEMVNAVDYLVKQGTLAAGDSIGYVYLQGEYGEPGFAGASFAAQRQGINVVGQQIDPNMADLSAPVGTLADKGVSAILMSATPRQVASAAAIASARGLNVPIVSAQPGWAAELLGTGSAPALIDNLLVVSSVAPFGSDAQGPTRVRELYQQKAPQVAASWGMSLGYAVSGIMDQALTAACEAGDLTRTGLQAAIRSKGTFDLTGTVVPLDYSDAARSPSIETFVMKPRADIPGGLVAVETGYTGPSVESYLAKR